MNNYEFCTQWILANRTATDVRVLDYGCGAGEIVKLLKRNGVDAYGCDVFYEGGDYSRTVDPALFGTVVKKMDATTGLIPFGNASFDFVINNQVMEHVENMDAVLREICRVLKPGGAVLSLFPDKGVLREGHCGIPLLHWFPKASGPRVYYAAMLRAFGFGYFKQGKSIWNWSRDICEWLDKWTFYRSRQTISQAYLAYFTRLSHIEDHWLQARLGTKGPLATCFPARAQKLIARKLGTLVFVASKPL